jgi:hypothetical protein
MSARPAVANNPSMAGVAQAPHPDTGHQHLADLRLGSLGTGTEPTYAAGRSHGRLKPCLGRQSRLTVPVRSNSRSGFFDLLDENLHEFIHDCRMLGADQIAVDHNIRRFIPLVDHLATRVLNIADDVVGAGDLPASDQIRIRARQPQKMADGPDLQAFGLKCFPQEAARRSLVLLTFPHFDLIAQAVHRIRAD